MIKAVTSESHLGADLRKLGLDSEVVDRSTINDTFLLAWLGFSCDGSKIEIVVLNVWLLLSFTFTVCTCIGCVFNNTTLRRKTVQHIKKQKLSWNLIKNVILKWEGMPYKIKFHTHFYKNTLHNFSIQINFNNKHKKIFNLNFHKNVQMVSALRKFTN